MSSTSSVCSSNDAEFILDSRISPTMRRDVERFSVFVGRLRAALDVNTNVPDGESMCVAVHSALEMVSESMRDLFKHSQFKTNQVILPSLQLVQSVKDLKFDSCLVDTTRVHQVIDLLESAVLNTIINRHVVSPNPGRYSTTLGRKSKQNSTDASFNVPLRSSTLQRRHSNYQNLESDENSPVMEADKVLFDRSDGVEIAFERSKQWSIYCKDLVSYVRARLQLEQDHARRVNNLVESSSRDIPKAWMGLREVWEDSFDCDKELMARTKETAEHLRDRVVEALDARRKDHEVQRAALKLEWTKVNKAVNDCEEGLDKARSGLRAREDAVRKAHELALRTESLGQGTSSDLLKRRRDMEKRKRAEEEAVVKREDAEKQVAILTAELRRKRRDSDKAKERIIEKLRELVFQCDQTTKACTSHYFKALATLWVKLPGSYQDLSDATRDFQPGSAYMSFLHNLPERTASSSSLIRSDRSVDEGVSCDGSSVPSSIRRNALNTGDAREERNIPDTLRSDLQKRHKKTSTAGRLFESHELSDAANTHCVQRTVQPSKCCHCDRLSIVFTVQCVDCQQLWHRNCYPKTSSSCGQAARSCSLDRRMSIFGVPLKGHLELQKRTIPQILETTIDELQKRGLRVKGLYRTCGVKSKIEEICESFEKSGGETEVDLSHIHPMNLASVVKLYLRKLPEPLLTFDLHQEWTRIGMSCPTESDEWAVEELHRTVSMLPEANLATLRHLMLHLNRVTWFKESNLMCPSNLATVVAPSLTWPPPSTASDHAAHLLHAQHSNTAVQALIRHAYEVFGVDQEADWQSFFGRYAVDEPTRDEDPGNESDVEDIHDDEAGEIDDEHIFIPQVAQPPTPDLLRNTKKTLEKTSDVGTSSCWQSSPEEQPRRDRSRLPRDKRRSYTTSILISPNCERPTLASSRQRSMEENTGLTICSGDVTIDVSKDQLVCGPTKSSGLARRQSTKETSSRTTPTSSDDSRILSIHNVGDLFPGTDHDVSYV